jgi:hypothetical protein
MAHRWPARPVALAVFALGLAGAGPTSAWAGEPVVVLPPRPDPHYTGVGFFDIRICNWPERARFMQVLFSTTKYDVVRKVDVLDPDGRLVGTFGLGQYRLIKEKDGSEKRVFIVSFPLDPGAKAGWYTGRITLADGTVHLAKDRVMLKSLPIAGNPQPAADAEDVDAPRQLSWDAVPGAKAYQVFLHDIWEGEAIILRSPHLTQNRVEIPAGLLKPGGYYMWRVHARDVDEDVELGDFDHGSLTPYFKFSVR